MKLYPGVYYYTDPATNELYIYNLDYNYTWYVLDSSTGVWNSINGIPAFGIENLKKY
jgi:hypothetical protein